MNIKQISLLTLSLVLGAASAGHAAGQEVTLSMKGGAFIPSSLEVPANTKIHLTVKNEGTDKVEFESYPLNQEHKIAAGESEDMYIGPLKAGEYAVFDDNNPDTKGSIVAK